VAVVGPRRSAPRSPRRASSRPTSGRRRSCGRTRSPPCSSRSRRATGSGGRLADRDPTLRGLCRMVLGSAALLALVPFVAGPFLRAAGQRAGRDRRRRVRRLAARRARCSWRRRWCCSARSRPYAVRLSVRSVEEAGRVTGRLYAISTLGSLVGVFLLAALALVPFAGTHRTFCPSRSRWPASRRWGWDGARGRPPAGPRGAAGGAGPAW